MACPPGTYSLVPASKATRLVTKQLTEVAAGRLCLPCEYGATCEGKDKPVTLKGFWIKPLAHTRNANARRSEAEQEGQEEEKEGVLRAQVYRCPPAACVGGGKCAAGREGPVCGICSDQYSVRSGTLRSWGWALWALAGCAFVAAWYWLAVRPLFTAERVEEEEEGGTNPVPRRRMAVLADEIGKELERKSVVMGTFKVIVSFYQLLGSFLYTFDVDWSMNHSSLMQYAAVSTFNFIALPGPNCMFVELPHVTKQLLYAFGPIAVILFFALPAVLAAAFDRFTARPSRWTRVSSSLIRTILVIMFVVYPMVTYQMLSNFRCQVPA